MNRTVLQIPIDTELRNKAEERAKELGFSSLQECVRVFLAQLAKGKIRIIFEEIEKGEFTKQHKR